MSIKENFIAYFYIKRNSLIIKSFSGIWQAWLISILMTIYLCLVIHLTFIIYIKVLLNFIYILMNIMGTLSTLSEIFSAVSQKESAYRTGTVWIFFEMHHQFKKYLFIIGFLRWFTSKYAPHRDDLSQSYVRICYHIVTMVSSLYNCCESHTCFTCNSRIPHLHFYCCSDSIGKEYMNYIRAT